MPHPTESVVRTTRRSVIQAAALAAVGIPTWATAQSENWRIGQSAPFVGPLAYPFIESRRGIAAAFKEVNDKGGIDGRMVELFSMDDGGDPAKAAENTKKLIEKDQVFCMFAGGGTASVMGSLKVSMPAKVPQIAPGSGSDALRAFNPLIFHTRASYSQELNKIAKQLSSTGFTKIAIPYFDDPFGKSALATFEAAAKLYKNTDWKPFLVENSAEGVKRAVDEIVAFQPTALMSFAIGPLGVPMFKELRSRIKATAFAISFLGSKPLMEALGEAAVGLTVAQVVPHPRYSALPVVQAYQVALKKLDGTEPNYSSLEGYINGRILLEGLRRTGRNGNREKLIEAMQTMRPYDLGGFEVSYSPTNHIGSDFVELSYYNGEKYRR